MNFKNVIIFFLFLPGLLLSQSIRDSTKSKGITIPTPEVQIAANTKLNLLESFKFSSVAGIQLGARINYSFDFDKYSASSYLGYGFSDKRVKFLFDFGTQLLNDRSLQIQFSGYTHLNSPFMKRKWDHDLNNLLYAFGMKRERFYYYYRTGFSLNVYKDIIPELKVGFGYENSTNKNAYVNSDLSVFNRDRVFKENPLIGEGTKRALNFSLQISKKDYPSLFFKTENSSKKLLGSTFDFSKYWVALSGQNKFSSFSDLKYQIGYQKANGNLPFQELLYIYVFAGESQLQFSVPTYGEFYGDEVFYLNLENNFGKIFPENIPVLKEVNFSGIFNIGRTTLSASLMNKYKFNNANETEGFFMETGFMFSKILNFAKVYFAWRLNNFTPDDNFILYFNFL